VTFSACSREWAFSQLPLPSQRRKPTGFKLKKDGKKTKGVVVSYDDGSEEHLGVTETA
jgi:hypothetical protein